MTRHTGTPTRLGDVFGRLTVVDAAPFRRRSRARWLCRCACGRLVDVDQRDLRSGDTKSCGCLKSERVTEQNARTKLKHGGKRRGLRTREYEAWCGAIQRCENPNNASFAHYGARGVSMFPGWRHDFAAFLDHMGPRPAGTSLDRIDPERGYEPGNVRWATHLEQQRNRRRHHLLTVNGETKCLAQWALESGLPLSTLFNRIKRGWSPQRAVSEPRRQAASFLPLLRDDSSERWVGTLVLEGQ